MRKFLFLNSAQQFSDFTLLLMRLFVGLFLILGVWDNITDSARMQEFVSFLAKYGFSSPKILAPVSVYLQLAIGLGFVLGLFTRWAGIFCVVHFVIAIVMVDRFAGMRGTFPSGCLVFIGLYLATYGAGRFSADAVLKANELPRANSGVRFKT
jgi:putative oxidoreductase